MSLIRRKDLVLTRPSKEITTQNIEETKQCIDALINSKLESQADYKSKIKESSNSQPTVVKYQPQGSTESHELLIKSAPIDPLAPVHHQTKRTHELEIVNSETKPQILRSTKPLTAAEKKEWEIAPSISQWKNIKSKVNDRQVSAQEVGISTKQFDLASALMEAENEEQLEGAAYNKKNELKSKLLAQKNNASRTDSRGTTKFDERLRIGKSTSKPKPSRKYINFSR